MKTPENYEEQPKPQGLGQEVVPFLIEKLQERRALGIARYGEALKTFNGRDQTRDSLEELLDFVQYFTAKLLEESAAPATLEQIRTTYATKLAALKQENGELKAALADAKGHILELNERVLGLSTTLSAAFTSANEAVKSLALQCATNILLEER